jgi:hypothetical protein
MGRQLVVVVEAARIAIFDILAPDRNVTIKQLTPLDRQDRSRPDIPIGYRNPFSPKPFIIVFIVFKYK